MSSSTPSASRMPQPAAISPIWEKLPRRITDPGYRGKPLCAGGNGVRVLVNGQEPSGGEALQNGLTVAAAAGGPVDICPFRPNRQRVNGLLKEHRFMYKMNRFHGQPPLF